MKKEITDKEFKDLKIEIEKKMSELKKLQERYKEIVGNAEYALLLYRDKLPKFNNNGKMFILIRDYNQRVERTLIKL